MEAAGQIDRGGLEVLDAEIRRIVDEAVAFADASPEPSAERLYQDVYSVPYGPYVPGPIER